MNSPSLPVSPRGLGLSVVPYMDLQYHCHVSRPRAVFCTVVMSPPGLCYCLAPVDCLDTPAHHLCQETFPYPYFHLSSALPPHPVCIPLARGRDCTGPQGHVSFGDYLSFSSSFPQTSEVLPSCLPSLTLFISFLVSPRIRKTSSNKSKLHHSLAMLPSKSFLMTLAFIFFI